MRLSTKGRYAVRAMVDLALHAHEGPVSRAEIAGRQGISADYIAHLFHRLQRAKLIRGVRGRSGGYLLARDPAHIRIGEIVRAVEGPMALTDCTVPGQETVCPRASRCVTRALWLKTAQAVAETLDSVTLADLCRQATES
ncbi:MAG TPA: Rrf2 family transcriptional regulator [Chloroflexi bacterium]|nr:Rrf2 family transcriptional regulator [Chloroflexota bacterium]